MYDVMFRQYGAKPIHVKVNSTVVPRKGEMLSIIHGGRKLRGEVMMVDYKVREDNNSEITVYVAE